MATHIFAFRVDASVRIGAGHTARCLTLATELRERGAECHFIQRALEGHMQDVIRQRGFSVHALERPTGAPEPIQDGDYPGWAGVSEAEDAVACLPIIQTIGAQQIIIDHYGFGALWHSLVRPVVERLIVIDDLANRSLDCDVLIDQNLSGGGASRYDGLVPDTCLRLCGPEYALLAPEYAKAREFTRPRRGPVSRVLVFYGGSDPTDQTGLAVRVLSRHEFEHIAVDVVIGRNYQNLANLQELAAGRNGVDFHQCLPTLLPLMLQADLAIGAGGATTWERCCVGLPAIVTPIAENQMPASHALAAVGGCLLLPPVAGEPQSMAAAENRLADALRSFINERGLLTKSAQVGWCLGEGIGARLVTEVLQPSATEDARLRPAGLGDEALYFRWANDPDVRKAAFSSEPIAWLQHREWFRARLARPDSFLWVMETPLGVPLGQFRVDIKDGCGVVDYSIESVLRGRGLGRRLIELGVDAWRGLSAGVPLIAEVNAGNERSARNCEGSGVFENPSPPGPGGGGRFRSPSSVIRTVGSTLTWPSYSPSGCVKGIVYSG